MMHHLLLVIAVASFSSCGMVLLMNDEKSKCSRDTRVID